MNREKFYTNRRNIVLLATLCCFLWGSAYPAIKGGYELFNISGGDIPSKLIFAGYRFALAGIIVLWVQIISKKNIFVLNKNSSSYIARNISNNITIYILLHRTCIYNRNKEFYNKWNRSIF